MPNLDGLSTLAALRRSSQRAIPAIFVRGWSEDPQILAGSRGSAEYMVTKSLRPATLANIARNLIKDFQAESREDIELALCGAIAAGDIAWVSPPKAGRALTRGASRSCRTCPPLGGLLQRWERARPECRG